MTIVDAIVILGFLFGPGALRCLDAGDSDDSGRVDIADAIYVLSFLFGGGPPPPAPFPDPGSDATADELGCEG